MRAWVREGVGAAFFPAQPSLHFISTHRVELLIHELCDRLRFA